MSEAKQSQDGQKKGLLRRFTPRKGAPGILISLNAHSHGKSLVSTGWYLRSIGQRKAAAPSRSPCPTMNLCTANGRVRRSSLVRNLRNPCAALGDTWAGTNMYATH